MSAPTGSYIDESTFHTDVEYIETLWRRMPVGALDMPLIDVGRGEPIVFAPRLEHLEFVYTPQIRTLSESRRVIIYRKHARRTRPIGLVQRAEEIRTQFCRLGRP